MFVGTKIGLFVRFHKFFLPCFGFLSKMLYLCKRIKFKVESLKFKEG